MFFDMLLDVDFLYGVDMGLWSSDAFYDINVIMGDVIFVKHSDVTRIQRRFGRVPSLSF